MSNPPILQYSHTFSDFYLNFLLKNQLCLFDQKLTLNWPSRKLWLSNCGISIDKLLEHFTDQILCVADCRKLEFGTHPMSNLSSADFCLYWKSRSGTASDRLLYLKDWHYFKQCPPQSCFETPIYFSSDWLNEFCAFRTDIEDDFKFVYVGPKGTWTPLHSDVYCSYSWSANIVGRKRWWVFPPGEEKKLNLLNDQLPSDIRFRKFAIPGDSDSDVPKCFVFDQLPGQTVFVPCGWYHEVINLTDCVSINHNWLNACNVRLVWQHLSNQLNLVKKSCADVEFTPGWNEACQNCLKAWEGWNYAEFFLLLKYIIVARWTRSSAEDLRKVLSEVNINDDSQMVPFFVLQEQVDVLLSKTAESSPDLIERLMLESFRSSSLEWQQNICNKLDDHKPPEWIRQHDLTEAGQTIKAMLQDPDFQLLGLHKTATVNWLWNKTKLLQ